MKRLGWLGVLSLLAGCGPNIPVPDVKIPDFCEQQVYADPAVRDEIMKGAGSDNYRDNHQVELAYAKLDAVNRCLRQRGLLPPGGGVEQPRRPGGSISHF
jgi:hypothetical protein